MCSESNNLKSISCSGQEVRSGALCSFPPCILRTFTDFGKRPVSNFNIIFTVPGHSHKKQVFTHSIHSHCVKVQQAESHTEPACYIRSRPCGCVTAMLQLLRPISLNEKEPLRSACARVWRRKYASGGPLCCGGGPGDRLCLHFNGFACEAVCFSSTLD